MCTILAAQKDGRKDGRGKRVALCPFSYAACIPFFLFLLAHIQVLMKGMFTY